MTPKKKKTEGDMTPMIDCVFLLLIFFIIAAKFITPEGHLDIWQPKDSGQSNSDPVELEELQDMRIYVRYGPSSDPDPVKKEKYSRDFELHLDKKHFGTFPYQLREWKLASKNEKTTGVNFQKFKKVEKQIKEAFTALTEELQSQIKSGVKSTMVLNIDPEVPYLFVVEAMNACTACELEDVKFSAQKQRLTKLHGGAIRTDR